LLDIGGAGSLGVGGTDGSVAREAFAIRPVELDKINYCLRLRVAQGGGRFGPAGGGLSSAHAASEE
jgi:hypothetical protein